RNVGVNRAALRVKSVLCVDGVRQTLLLANRIEEPPCKAGNNVFQYEQGISIITGSRNAWKSVHKPSLLPRCGFCSLLCFRFYTRRGQRSDLALMQIFIGQSVRERCDEARAACIPCDDNRRHQLPLIRLEPRLQVLFGDCLDGWLCADCRTS